MLSGIKFARLKFFRLATEELSSNSILKEGTWGFLLHNSENFPSNWKKRKPTIYRFWIELDSLYTNINKIIQKIIHPQFFSGYFKEGLHTEVLWRREESPVQKSLKPWHKSWKLFQPLACVGPSGNWRSPKTRSGYSLEIYGRSWVDLWRRLELAFRPQFLVELA